MNSESEKASPLLRQRSATTALALVPAIYLVAFLAMAAIRSQQGHGGQVPPSEIEGLAVRRQPADPVGEARARGQLVYQQYCRYCHGDNGDGNGQNASRLAETMGVQPQNFTDAKFWQRKETTAQRLRDAIVSGGPINGKSVLMPAWGHTLTDDQIRDVLAYIEGFRSASRSQP